MSIINGEHQNCGEREHALEKLRAAFEKAVTEAEGGCGREQIDLLWDAIVLFEGYPFYTAKGLCYDYTVRGNEIFFSRKEKSVTKATVIIAFERAMQIQADGGSVTGPKKLGCFGASYIYPVFKRFGLI